MITSQLEASRPGLTLALALTLISTACGGLEPGVETAASVTGLVGATLSIPFVATVQGAPFSCDRSYPGVGLTASTFTPSDLRLYVHGFELLHADGTAEAARLVQDGRWQYDQVALLDFEDRTGACRNGTADVRNVVEIEAPRAAITGLRFKVGVPFALNHANQALAPSPLNLSALFWSWSAGYKFLRLEGRIAEAGPMRVHIGSIGCAADASGAVVACAAPNRAEVELAAFDPALDKVVFDVGALLSGSSFTAGETAATSCMGQPTDPACRPVFERLGLGVDGLPASAQVVFHATR